MPSNRPLIVTPQAIVRPLSLHDVSSLARAANSPAVARNLRHRFPSPYTEADAAAWIQSRLALERPCHFAIADARTDEAIGGIGIELGEDVHFRTAEFGYWLGEAHWGRGIMSAIARPFVEWVFRNVKVRSEYEGEREFGLLRLFAVGFVENVASRRVVERAGFVHEGVTKASAYKHGRVLDQWMYAMTVHGDETS